MGGFLERGVNRENERGGGGGGLTTLFTITQARGLSWMARLAFSFCSLFYFSGTMHVKV